MPHGIHKLTQTAFRLPEDLLAWLKQKSEREGRPMTEIVIGALERERRQDESGPR
jgi:predicted DNA-binding protein